jgi:hypothetical protein
MEELVLTRYLFSYSEVKHSLFIEILDGNVEPALYWGYELYWSGYEEDTIEWLLSTYELMFDLNEEFKRRIRKEYEEWKEDNTRYEKIGTIIINMCYRPYSISKFTNKYFSTQCREKEVEKRDSKLYINLKKGDVKEYKTEYGEVGKRYKITNDLYKYELRTEVNSIFRYDIKKEEQEKSLFYNWEYYAIRSPYWKEQFEKYGGGVKDGKIAFNTEEELEEFYNIYSLEIDEKSKETQERVIGINKKKEMTLTNFVNKYNGLLKTKKLKKKVSV